MTTARDSSPTDRTMTATLAVQMADICVPDASKEISDEAARAIYALGSTALLFASAAESDIITRCLILIDVRAVPLSKNKIFFVWGRDLANLVARSADLRVRFMASGSGKPVPALARKLVAMTATDQKGRIQDPWMTRHVITSIEVFVGKNKEAKGICSQILDAVTKHIDEARFGNGRAPAELAHRLAEQLAALYPQQPATR